MMKLKGAEKVRGVDDLLRDSEKILNDAIRAADKAVHEIIDKFSDTDDYPHGQAGGGAHAPARMEQFLGRHGLRAPIEAVDGYADRFLLEMRRGLAGEPSSLSMLPTYIGLEEGRVYAGDVIVIDAGGTNLRVALVRLAVNAPPQTLYFEKYPMLGTQGEITVDAFFDGLAGYLAPIADKTDRIGVCFSFPAEILPSRDARILFFNKEVRVSGARGAVIGEGLRAAMKARGLPCGHSVVVTNDTVSSLLGAYAANTDGKAWGSYVGFILGTGINSCYMEDNRSISKAPALRGRPGGTIINMESGGFAGMPQSTVDAAFIAKTDDPGVQLMEKMSSGAYQSGLLHAYIRAAAQEGCFSDGFTGRLSGLATLSGLDVDRFCDYPYGDNPLARLCADENDTQSLYALTDAFFDRVALFAAALLTAILRALGDRARNPCRPVCISAEGTTFYKARLLRPKLEYVMAARAERAMGLYCRFVKVNDATIIGTALAGLMGNA